MLGIDSFHLDMTCWFASITVRENERQRRL